MASSARPPGGGVSRSATDLQGVQRGVEVGAVPRAAGLARLDVLEPQDEPVVDVERPQQPGGRCLGGQRLELAGLLAVGLGEHPLRLGRGGLHEVPAAVLAGQHRGEAGREAGRPASRRSTTGDPSPVLDRGADARRQVAPLDPAGGAAVRDGVGYGVRAHAGQSAPPDAGSASRAAAAAPTRSRASRRRGPAGDGRRRTGPGARGRRVVEGRQPGGHGDGAELGALERAGAPAGRRARRGRGGRRGGRRRCPARRGRRTRRGRGRRSRGPGRCRPFSRRDQTPCSAWSSSSSSANARAGAGRRTARRRGRPTTSRRRRPCGRAPGPRREWCSDRLRCSSGHVSTLGTLRDAATAAEGRVFGAHPGAEHRDAGVRPWSDARPRPVDPYAREVYVPGYVAADEAPLGRERAAGLPDCGSRLSSTRPPWRPAWSWSPSAQRGDEPSGCAVALVAVALLPWPLELLRPGTLVAAVRRADRRLPRRRLMLVQPVDYDFAPLLPGADGRPRDRAASVPAAGCAVLAAGLAVVVTALAVDGHAALERRPGSGPRRWSVALDIGFVHQVPAAAHRGAGPRARDPGAPGRARGAPADRPRGARPGRALAERHDAAPDRRPPRPRGRRRRHRGRRGACARPSGSAARRSRTYAARSACSASRRRARPARADGPRTRRAGRGLPGRRPGRRADDDRATSTRCRRRPALGPLPDRAGVADQRGQAQPGRHRVRCVLDLASRPGPPQRAQRRSRRAPAGRRRAPGSRAWPSAPSCSGASLTAGPTGTSGSSQVELPARRHGPRRRPATSARCLGWPAALPPDRPMSRRERRADDGAGPGPARRRPGAGALGTAPDPAPPRRRAGRGGVRGRRPGRRPRSREHRPDVVVMDLRMRRVNGIDATRALRRQPGRAARPGAHDLRRRRAAGRARCAPVRRGSCSRTARPRTWSAGSWRWPRARRCSTRPSPRGCSTPFRTAPEPAPRPPTPR